MGRLGCDLRCAVGGLRCSAVCVRARMGARCARSSGLQRAVCAGIGAFGGVGSLGGPGGGSRGGPELLGCSARLRAESGRAVLSECRCGCGTGRG